MDGADAITFSLALFKLNCLTVIYRGLAITGTDTGVGKTAAARAMIRLLSERGLIIGALKPVETGCEGDALVPLDGMALAEAARLRVKGFSVEEGGWSDGVIEMADLVPWRLKAPLAPEEAARLEGIEISVDRVYQAMNRWMERNAAPVVETAGGIMVPINSRFKFIDLLLGMELPVMVVAANRLGAINHTILTVEALARRGLEVIGIALNSVDPEPDLSAATNAEVIRRHLAPPVFEIPYHAGEDPSLAARAALEPHADRLAERVEKEWERIKTRYIKGKKSGKESG